MNFILFKPIIKRTNIYVCITSLIFLLIGIITVLCLKDIDTNAVKIPLAILFFLNYIFLSAFIYFLFKFKNFISFIYLVSKTRYEDDNGNIIKEEKKLQVNPLIFLMVIFFILIFFIELTVTMGGSSNNWIEAVKLNWWPILIIFITNLLIFFGATYYNLYKFNKDQKLINNL